MDAAFNFWRNFLGIDNISDEMTSRRASKTGLKNLLARITKIQEEEYLKMWWLCYLRKKAYQEEVLPAP